MRSKIISLSAISAAFVAISLTVGAYFEFADLFAVVISSVFIMLPLYLGSYKGCLLGYLAGGFIAFLCSGFNFLSLVFPSYFAFFGVYPIVKSKFEDMSFNKIIGYIIGVVWFLIVAYGVFFYYTLFMGKVISDLPEFIAKYILILLAPISIVFFAIYNRFVVVMRLFLNRYLSRIVK
jgi:hypothetical protein